MLNLLHLLQPLFNFYYLFGYEETKEAFQIPHDLKILQEVFKFPDGNYARPNMFWKSHDMRKLVSIPPGIEGQRLDQQIKRIKEAFNDFSKSYQKSKTKTTYH